DVIPNMTITEFKKFHAKDIKKMMSVEVFSDGEHLFTAVIPKGDWLTKDVVKAEAESVAMRSNMLEGLKPEEVTLASV
ncbi:unnamed protein product, partial [marine sediment metagenome]